VTESQQQKDGEPSHHAEHTEGGATGRAADSLPRAVHYAVPVLSIVILLAFASMAFFPSNTAALPVQSTVLFIPIYLAIVIFLVLASIYVFKAFVESDVGFKEG
jgi:hypothetical protein